MASKILLVFCLNSCPCSTPVHIWNCFRQLETLYSLSRKGPWKMLLQFFLQIFRPPHPLSHASSVAFYVECERIFVVMVMQGARAVAQMSWKYPRRPPNSHEYPPWRMMRVWAVKYVHLGSSENPKTHHTQHTSQQLQILCQFSSASTKSSQTL